MRILPFLLLLLAFEAGAATWYVRPSTVCANNGNGTAYSCAASAGAAGAWRAMTGVVQATPATGGVVKVCGSFSTADADTATVMLVINWTNSGVILDGDCSADGDLSMAILDGEGTRDRGLDSSSVGAVSATIKNIDFRGFDVHAIIGQNAASKDWVIENIRCDGSYGLTCIRNLTAGATGWVVQDSYLGNCAVDCIYTANPMTLRRVTGREWSTGGVEGDFLQSSNTSCSGFVFEDLDLESTKDIKQAIITNACSDALDITVSGGRYVKTSLSTDDTTGFVPLFFEGGSGTVTIDQVFAKNGRKNAFITGGASLVVRSSIFGESLTQNIQCGTSTTACTIEQNSIAGGSIGIDMQAAAAGGVARNNAISGAAIGISKGATGSESYNAINSPDPCWSAGATASCAASDQLAAPQFLGGDTPTTAEGFKPDCLASPLKNAGTNVGRIQDFTGRYFDDQPDIGAFACQGGTPRTTPTARAVSTQRTTPTARAAAEARP